MELREGETKEKNSETDWESVKSIIFVYQDQQQGLFRVM